MIKLCSDKDLFVCVYVWNWPSCKAVQKDLAMIRCSISILCSFLVVLKPADIAWPAATTRRSGVGYIALDKYDERQSEHSPIIHSIQKTQSQAPKSQERQRMETSLFHIHIADLYKNGNRQLPTWYVGTYCLFICHLLPGIYSSKTLFCPLL